MINHPCFVLVLDFDDMFTRGSTSDAYFKANFVLDERPFDEGRVVGLMQKFLMIEEGMSRGDALTPSILQVNNMFRKGPMQRGRYVGKGEPQEVPFTRQSCIEMADYVPYAPGAEDFIPRIKVVGEEHKVDVYAFIVSSNVKTFLEVTAPGRQADAIYSSEYEFNERGEVIGFKGEWMSPERKRETVQMLRQTHICKHADVEKISLAHYMGADDGDTGRLFLQLIREGGGISIGVQTPCADQPHLVKMLEDGCVNQLAINDFTEGSDIWRACTSQIERIASTRVAVPILNRELRPAVGRNIDLERGGVPSSRR